MQVHGHLQVQAEVEVEAGKWTVASEKVEGGMWNVERRCSGHHGTRLNSGWYSSRNLAFQLV